ncbi:MAG: response regulator transcription factor [Deltaproteobacteria bacterium]|nr:response regulator transcription factor [Deltaproteobacteria bacterium]
MVAQETEALAELRSEIALNGFACSIVPHVEGLAEEVITHRPDLLLFEVGGNLSVSDIQEFVQGMKGARRLPVIALLPGDTLDSLNGNLDIDDFITSPYDVHELVLRARRVLSRARNIDGGELIKCDGLVIDLAKCEVNLEGEIVELTFKEYELLKFLASHRGRVYSREALLNKVWGYDYYGGDRTVDVHVRRLRSKIEDAKHTFIETVRNIGYRFKA